VPPLIEAISVGARDRDPARPLMLKGVSEIAVIGPAPAIANAVFDATGIRLARAAAEARRTAGRCVPPLRATGGRMMDLDLTINGARHRLAADPRATLLDVLREELGLAGTKRGCNHGQCGACTVLLDGRRVLSCLTLAASVRAPVTTIEGLAPPERAAAPDAAGLSRPRRAAMRLLHARPDSQRHRLRCGRPRRQRGGGAGGDERQPVPLRRLPEHRGGGDGRRSRDARGGRAMKPFGYERAVDAADAARRFAAAPGAEFLAGGTTVLDLMKLGVLEPARLVEILDLRPDYDAVVSGEDGATIGALATLAEVAANPAIRTRWAAVAQALDQVASPQIRNAATVGGSLMQRTRCAYFRDPASACNKRRLGAGCAALAGGHTRDLAVLGTSAYCSAAYPGDLAVALVALDASLTILGADGITDRCLLADDLHREPGDRPDLDTTLAPGELILVVRLPERPLGRLALPEAARPRSLRLRAGIRRGRAADGGGAGGRGAHRAGRPGRAALALPGRGGAAAGPEPGPEARGGSGRAVLRGCRDGRCARVQGRVGPKSGRARPSRCRGRDAAGQ
jgi:xanthine dehydrogenase YagS FAD-binding subunit